MMPRVSDAPGLFDHVLARGRAREAVSDAAWLRAMLDVEAALAHALADVRADDFDALILPGGTCNPDTLRQNGDVIRFVQAIASAGKPIAAICHAPWTLVEADLVRGRTLTSFPSVRTDIRNAGGTVVDEEVVCDEALITSRNPNDLDAFCAKIVEEFQEGKHPVADQGATAQA